MRIKTRRIGKVIGEKHRVCDVQEHFNLINRNGKIRKEETYMRRKILWNQFGFMEKGNAILNYPS